MSMKVLFRGLLAAALIVGSLWRLEQSPHSQTTSAIAAYRSGDWETAVSLFGQAAEAETSQGQEIQAQKNLALAALQAGELEMATAAAAAVAASGRLEDLAWHDFFLGNLAWKRSLGAEVEAHGPVPPAGALELAIGQARVAREAWQSALDMKNAWPEAQRNLERANSRLSSLEEELQSTSSADAPESEKMPSSPDASAPPLSEAKQLQLMQQLERLDRQSAAKAAAQKPKPSGAWKW